MRFLFTIGATLIVVFMALGTIYFWGLGQISPKFDHPFFEHSRPWLVLPRKLMEKGPPGSVAWVDVYKAVDGTLVVDQRDSQQTLSQLLTESAHGRWILNIVDNENDEDRQLNDILAPLADKQDFVVQSEFDIVLRSTKDLLARVPYGSSQSDRMRFQSFEAMAPWLGGLLPATPFKGDIFISALKWRNLKLIDQQIAAELKRRQKAFILGPLQNKDDVLLAKSLAPDGYFINDLNLLAVLGF